MNGPQKHDAEKVRLELIPPEFVTGVGAALTFGARKYSAGNWSTGDGFAWSRLYGAALRHLMAWGSGENSDPESGLLHLYHAGCMIAFLAAHVERGLGVDDRVKIGIQPRPSDLRLRASDFESLRKLTPATTNGARNGHAAD